MKLKQHADDFAVEELSDRTPVGQGPFALYRLEKEGWTTPDALQAVRRRWKIEPARLSYGGLKDRHAHTIQFFTIFHGPRRSLSQQGVRVEYLGQATAPYTSKDIRVNRFRITLRDVAGESSDGIRQALDEIRADGLPNYFDDQRFGSVSPKDGGGEFIARLMVRGHYEEALRLALAAPYEYDRAATKQEKQILRAHWGTWAECKERLPRGHARSLVDYLVHHPDDFRGALQRMRPELLSLYLSAYQSHLWNRMLAKWLQKHCRPDQLVPVALRLGPAPMPRGLDHRQLETFARLQLPLPSARLRLSPDDPRHALVRDVMAEEGFELNELKLKGFRKPFFSRGDRGAQCRPQELAHEFAPDEDHPGRQRLTLSFELPRGSYATLIVKRLQTV